MGLLATVVGVAMTAGDRSELGTQRAIERINDRRLHRLMRAADDGTTVTG